MNAKEIELLLALSEKNIKAPAEAIGVTHVRAKVVRRLVQDGFAVRKNGLIGLADTAHATLFRKFARRGEGVGHQGARTEPMSVMVRGNGK